MRKNYRFGFLLDFALIVFLISINTKTLGQYYPESFYKSPRLDSTRNKTLMFKIENSNFLRNSEYFNNIVQGYTLLGYHISPKLIYYPAKFAKIEIGAHLLKYSGLDKFTKALPILSFNYQAGKSTNIIIGTLDGTTNHNLIDPVFDNEKFFTENSENGLQFLFDTRIYKGDIWINWQDFIFKDDNNQEVFTMGLSNRFFLNDKNARHSFVTTYNNSAFGICYKYTFENQFIQSVSMESMLVSFNDMSSQHLFPYINGYGVYSTIQAKAGFFNLTVSHWYGDFYISTRGQPIYQCLSTIYPGYKEPQRALISTRSYFEKKLLNGLYVGANFETFSDLYNRSLDYGYSFYINFNTDFFIKNFKKN